MTINDMFGLRSRTDFLSPDAFLLLVFIIYRLEGTKFEDEKGKYILMSKENDPRHIFHWSNAKFSRLKAELKKHHLIEITRSNMAKPGKVYTTHELSDLRTRELSKVITRELSDLRTASYQNREHAYIKSDNSLYIEREKKGNRKGERESGAVAPTTSRPANFDQLSDADKLRILKSELGRKK